MAAPFIGISLQSIKYMWLQNEYEITLIRMLIPAANPPNKLTLSVSTTSFQFFIQTQHGVKDKRVNFFREKIFIPSIKDGIVFRIYATDSQQKCLIKEIHIRQDELVACQKTPLFFHTYQDQYEIAWEASVFTPSDSENNEATDRDYTELRDDAYLFLKNVARDSTPTKKSSFINLRKKTTECFQRSTSAESSSNSAVQDLSRGIQGSKETPRWKDDSYGFSKGRINNKGDYLLKPRKAGIRNFFSYLSTGISEFFSRSTA